ncbi:MAG: M23 family metallopeptidase [Acidobacteriota bacterium]|nr:M23 family metallopeptidase [Acidobacteriota bacterium]
MVRTAACLLVLLAVPACAAEAPLPLDLRVLSRAPVPGEPLRVVVRSAEPLASLTVRLLDRDVFMSRFGSEDGAEIWTGWGIVDLTQEPTTSTVDAHGVTESGREAIGSRAFVVEAKEFPVENLSVSGKYVTPSPEAEARLAEEREKLAGVYASRSPIPPLAAPFARPVPGEPTSVFGTRRLFNGKPRDPHPGLDLRAATGTSVAASGPGRIVLAQDLYYSGNTVIVDHGGGLFTLYAHLSELRVREGQIVATGEAVGLSGATGRVTGPHLHWGAKIGDRPFDPRALLDPALF